MQSNWYDRVSALRQQAEQDPNAAGVEALHLFEDWLYEQAKQLDYRPPHNGMANYIDYLKSRGRLSTEEMARAKRFVDLRNCLSHRAGLLMSGALTGELLDFVTTLFRRDALSAEQLMTRQPLTVRPDDPLLVARDLMLEHGLSRLPVMDGERVIALLTNRDILRRQALDEGAGDASATLDVADAMSADELEQIVFLPPAAPYSEVLAHLKSPRVAAIFVTAGGQPERPLLGVISVSDLLPKL